MRTPHSSFFVDVPDTMYHHRDDIDNALKIFAEIMMTQLKAQVTDWELLNLAESIYVHSGLSKTILCCASALPSMKASFEPVSVGSPRSIVSELLGSSPIMKDNDIDVAVRNDVAVTPHCNNFLFFTGRRQRFMLRYPTLREITQNWSQQSQAWLCTSKPTVSGEEMNPVHGEDSLMVQTACNTELQDGVSNEFEMGKLKRAVEKYCTFFDVRLEELLSTLEMEDIFIH